MRYMIKQLIDSYWRKIWGRILNGADREFVAMLIATICQAKNFRRKGDESGLRVDEDYILWGNDTISVRRMANEFTTGERN